MKRMPLRLLYIISLVLGHATLANAIVIADLGRDMSLTSNPNGVWAYGVATSPGAALSYFDSTRTFGPGPDFVDWYPSGHIGPVVAANLTNGSYTLNSATWNAHEANMHPGEDNRYAVARLTIPFAMTGTYSIQFRGAAWDTPTTTDVHVWRNGASLLSSGLAGLGSVVTYAISGSFLAGETIDLYVGPGGNGWASDATGVTAILSGDALDVPEPAMLGAFSAVLLGLSLRRRRKPCS